MVKFTCYLFAILVGLSFAEKCKKIQPGLNKLRKGVDITKLDWLPLNQKKDSGFRLSVIDFTCSKPKAANRSCLASPFKRQKQEDDYQTPDQITNININPGGTLSSTIEIYKTAHDYQRTISAEASISYGGGVVSASASYEKIQRSIEKNENYVQESQVHVTTFDVELKTSIQMELSRGAKAHVDMLPSDINDGNVGQFLKFISDFGTHRMLTGKFGGSIRFFIETKKKYYETHNEDKVRMEVGGMVSGVTGSASFGYSASQTDQEFNENSKKTISYFGGDTNLLSEGNGLKDWQPTVKDRPMLFTGTLSPIYDLIKDETKKGLVKTASEIYIAKAHLKDITKNLELVKLKAKALDDQGLPDMSTFMNIFNAVKENISDEIKSLKSKPMLLKKDVVQLACTIKSNFNTECKKEQRKVVIKFKSEHLFDRVVEHCTNFFNKPFGEADI